LYIRYTTIVAYRLVATLYMPVGSTPMQQSLAMNQSSMPSSPPSQPPSYRPSLSYAEHTATGLQIGLTLGILLFLLILLLFVMSILRRRRTVTHLPTAQIAPIVPAPAPLHVHPPQSAISGPPYGAPDRIVAETLERERVMALRALPTYVWAGGSDSGETCVLCIEPFHNGASLRKLPCNHLYHKECIDKWLIFSMVSVHSARVLTLPLEHGSMGVPQVGATLITCPHASLLHHPAGPYETSMSPLQGGPHPERAHWWAEADIFDGGNATCGDADDRRAGTAHARRVDSQRLLVRSIPRLRPQLTIREPARGPRTIAMLGVAFP
jgi:hypothetical protein